MVQFCLRSVLDQSRDHDVWYVFRRTAARSSNPPNVHEPAHGVANEGAYEMMDPPPAQEAKPYAALHAA